MANEISILKGLHPGVVLERELQKRKLSKGRFAISINEFPQTLSAIIKGKRSMNTSLALKIEEALHKEEGYFMTLQVFYDIKELKRKSKEASSPDLSLLRKVLFWDTDINKIDWERQKIAVILRVWERGNEEERNEIVRFYGKEVVDAVLKDKVDNKNNTRHVAEKNVLEYSKHTT
jgi:addiction module HigA family antidote